MVALCPLRHQSVDADMFRFGKGREVASNLNAQKPTLTCANCNNVLADANVEAFRRLSTGSGSCDVVVIGVLSKNKMVS